ncbi:type II toxin-antitoxin system RelE/ParE family toxin [Endozoicomonas sp. 4G]|uniref:type II toxin-antitoxin system RelE/ParE family toxin n=1 Tax=Endozoicomonas sp. 4G TaxID=2872754 RepID=UPI002078BD01|nr:type II toxin-antitoxin system RelE/ParE family toxin [Endozoicomonas sp. 4G]
MAKAKTILQTVRFARAVKKLKPNQKADLDTAIKAIADNPDIGDKKKGVLSHLRVYKFKMTKQLTLLAYYFDDGELVLELISFGSHENFYRNLERQERQ